MENDCNPFAGTEFQSHMTGRGRRHKIIASLPQMLLTPKYEARKNEY